MLTHGKSEDELIVRYLGLTHRKHRAPVDPTSNSGPEPAVQQDCDVGHVCSLTFSRSKLQNGKEKQVE